MLQLVREIAAVMQEFTQSGGVRPFGVSLLVSGVDDDGPQLYQVDPTGAYFGWRASAIGKNYANAKTFLEKRYAPDMELEDAIHTGACVPPVPPVLCALTHTLASSHAQRCSHCGTALRAR